MAPRPSNGKKETAKPVRRAKSKGQPVLKEIRISASVGGKVALVSYGNLTSDYHHSSSVVYEIPEDWTEAEVVEFRQAKQAALQHEVDQLAQRDADSLMEQSALFNESSKLSKGDWTYDD